MAAMGDRIAARFSRRVTAERKRRRWTVAELSAKTGVGVSAIGYLEREDRGCRLETAVLLAAALGISLDGLAAPCGRCGDGPAPGFTCRACGTEGPEPEPQQRGGGRDA
jgi:transcriptional regulator with XRE-family HTH domain